MLFCHDVAVGYMEYTPWQTFTNYFPKCGISEEAVTSATADNDNPFAGLEEDNKDARDQDLENRFTILEN